jgi:hypothetical protein
MARRKVPSQAASGADTFSDNLVGVQITTGTGQLTNTNFNLDNPIIQRDPKTFKTNPFSDFLTLDDLKGETETGELKSAKTPRKKEIKFKGEKKDAAKSLFGSLNQRIYVSVKNIIKKFPAGITIDKDSFVTVSGFTAFNIQYDVLTDTTLFSFESGMLYNPFDILIQKPLTNVEVVVENPLRNFYSSYKKYVLHIKSKR